MSAHTATTSAPDEEVDGAYGNTTWRALSAFATEQHQALRRAFDAAPVASIAGQVEHHQEASTTDQINFERSVPAAQQPTNAEFPASSGESQSAGSTGLTIVEEVERMRERTSILNPETDVVVRLDFASGGGSRAAVLAVVASLMIAATVFIAQAVKKFQLVSVLRHGNSFPCYTVAPAHCTTHNTNTLNALQGSAPYDYRDTAMYKGHAAVAVICLVTLTTFIANALWNLFIVVRQKKTW